MISYLSIVLAILWLWILDLDDVTALVLIGASYVLVSNILLNFNLERNYAYNGSVLWILAAGTAIYFVNGRGLDGYYDALLAPLFFFAITLAFLVDRLTKNRELEEGRILAIISNLIEEKPGKVNDYLARILSISKARSLKEINIEYERLQFEEVGERNRVLLNELIMSRIKGVKYSEVVVLVLTGFLSVAVSIFYRPDGFIYDLFALVLTTAIVFNLLYIYDRENDRSRTFVEIESYNEKLYPIIIFGEERDVTRIEKLIASLLLGGVLVIFSLAFMVKQGML